MGLLLIIELRKEKEKRKLRFSIANYLPAQRTQKIYSEQISLPVLSKENKSD